MTLGRSCRRPKVAPSVKCCFLTLSVYKKHQQCHCDSGGCMKEGFVLIIQCLYKGWSSSCLVDKDSRELGDKMFSVEQNGSEFPALADRNARARTVIIGKAWLLQDAVIVWLWVCVRIQITCLLVCLLFICPSEVKQHTQYKHTVRTFCKLICSSSMCLFIVWTYIPLLWFF